MSARALTFVIPGELSTLTGGYAYDRRISEGLRQLGWEVRVRALHRSFPRPDEIAVAAAEAEFARLPEHSLVLVDGLAFGALAETARRHAQRLKLVALVHHPLAAEHGLTRAARDGLRTSEQRALQFARRIIVTSVFTRDALREYEVDAGRVVVAEPGTDAAPLTHPADRDELTLTCVATLTPRKAHAVLFEALAQLKHLKWRLTCVGSADRDAVHAARVQAQARELCIDERVIFTGEVEQTNLEAILRDTDLCVMTALYEGYGMAVAEALARGIPVIATATGAAPTLLDAGAGLIVPPGDVGALRAALARVLSDRAVLNSWREDALRARERLPSWGTTLGTIANVLTELVG